MTEALVRELHRYADAARRLKGWELEFEPEPLAAGPPWDYELLAQFFDQCRNGTFDEIGTVIGRDELDTRRQGRSDFLNLFPFRPKLIEDNRLSLQLENGSRVVSLPGSEATVRGFSKVDLIIEDEASRVSDDLYRAIRPMLAVSGGRLVLMSTPFGKRGHFFEEWTNGSDWHRVIIPATKCPRISKDFLDKELASLGEWWFQQEYMCQFVETEDHVFPYDLIKEAIDDEIRLLPI